MLDTPAFSTASVIPRPLPRRCLPSVSMLCVHLIDRFLASLSDRPGIGPEAEIDRPPVMAERVLVQLRQQLIEAQQPLAERNVRGGLVIVKGAIRVDQV